MQANDTPEIFKPVDFCFPGSKTNEDMQGTVSVHADRMVIFIPRANGDGPYHIIGSKVGSVYVGVNDDTENRSRLKVDAKWADLGDILVGQWREGTEEYLFSFRLRNKNRSL